MPPFPFFQKGGTCVGGALEPPTYSIGSKTSVNNIINNGIIYINIDYIG